MAAKYLQKTKCVLNQSKKYIYLYLISCIRENLDFQTYQAAQKVKFIRASKYFKKFYTTDIVDFYTPPSLSLSVMQNQTYLNHT